MPLLAMAVYHMFILLLFFRPCRISSLLRSSPDPLLSTSFPEEQCSQTMLRESSSKKEVRHTESKKQTNKLVHICPSFFLPVSQIIQLILAQPHCSLSFSLSASPSKFFSNGNSILFQLEGEFWVRWLPGPEKRLHALFIHRY